MTKPSTSTYPISDNYACPEIPKNYTCGNLTVMPTKTEDCTRNNIPGIVYCCLYTGVALGQNVGICVINTVRQLQYLNGTTEFNWILNGVDMSVTCKSTKLFLKMIFTIIILIMLI
jgi:hypothetical protein